MYTKKNKLIHRKDAGDILFHKFDYENNCLRLIEILYQVLDVYRGEHFTHYTKEQYAHALANKFLNHAYTIFVLTRYEKETNKPNAQVEISMLASIEVLVRASLEAYLIFYYVFINPKTTGEKEFRFFSYVLSGYLERGKIYDGSPVSYEYGDMILNDKRNAMRFRRNLKANTKFQKLTPKEKGKVLDGMWRLESWTSIAQKARFNGQIVIPIYRYLCGYAHSDSLSVRQLQKVNFMGKQFSSIDSMIVLLNICIAKMIKAYCIVFPLAKINLSGPGVGEFVDIWENQTDSND